MTRRVLFAGLFHETNMFVEGMTSLKNFAILRGEELMLSDGDSSPLGGALESARKFGWTILPMVDFRASPSALVKDEVVETFWREFKNRANPELAQGVDAIYLVLHGAMVSQSLTDVEGEILERIRKLPGAENIPVFGVFDLHANFTERMAANSNCLVAYRENPHTDARQAAQIAAELLQRCFETGKTPRTFWQHPPLMWPPTGTASASEPMLSLEKLARQIEAESAEVWCANVVAGFSFADIPETGVSFTISTVGSEIEARENLEKLFQLALQKKELGNVTEPPIDEIMGSTGHWPVPSGDSPDGMGRKPQNRTSDDLLMNASPVPVGESPTGRSGSPVLPTVLVEPSDNIGGGAPGDGTGILRALVKNEVRNAAVCINDPEVVAKLKKLSVGAKTILSIGGKGSRLDAGPLSLEVELISRSDGKFELEDKQSHLASMSGNYFEMGPTAVVKHEGILILLTSNKTPPFDLGQWRSQGIEPTKLSVIGVKAAVAHRRAYDPIAARMYWVDTPGPCSSNLKTLPFKNVNRPIYPLDEL
ncbi:MAG: M81 family metallopeptidase [Verrucomicrobiota bacterium]